jgi:hypothetical protein
VELALVWVKLSDLLLDELSDVKLDLVLDELLDSMWDELLDVQLAMVWEGSSDLPSD